MSDSLPSLKAPTAGRLGFGPAPDANIPLPAPDYDLQVAEARRKAATTVGDQLGAIWRQDSLADPFVAQLAASSIEPDPNYNPYKDPNWAELSAGISPEFQTYLGQATSAGHALFLRDRLLQKQKDLQVLGDMGVAGNVGRFALNFLMPDQLLVGMSGGWVARGVRAFDLLNTAKGASAIARAETTAARVASEARNASGARAALAGTAAGGVENAAIEAVRQNMNYENDTSGVAIAGLMGAAFTAPFALAGSRQASRIAAAAEQELAVVSALRAADEGRALSPEQLRLIEDTHRKIEAVKRLESGELTEEQYLRGVEEFMGPREPLDRYAARLNAEVQEGIRSQARAIIEEFYTPKDTSPLPKPPAKPTEPAPLQVSQAELAAANRANPELEGKLTTEMRRVREELLGLRKDQLKKQEREDFWAKIEADLQAKKAKELDSIAAERDLQDAGLVEAPAAREVSPTDSQVTPVAEPVAPKAAELGADAYVGQEVNWTSKRTGEDFTGTVRGVNSAGRLEIEDSFGKIHSVAHTDLWEHTSGPAPEGFLPGSVGAAQALPTGYVDQFSSRFTGYHTVPGTNGKLKVPARFDLYAYLNESKVDGVRALAHKLIKDPVGQKDGAAQDFTASEWRSHLKRVIGGEFHREAGEAYRAAVEAAQVPLWKRGEFRTQFYEVASRNLRGDITALNELPAAARQHAEAVSASMRKTFDRYLAEAQKAGVQGAEGVAPNDFYVSRVWRQDKIREAMALHGEDAVYQLLANAMTGFNTRGPLTGNVDKAKSFLKTVMRLEYSHALQSVHLAGRDMHTLREELKAAGLAEHDIDTIVNTMFEVKAGSGGDSGNPAPLKFRFDLDETIGMQLPTGTLRLSDLLENDARVLIDRYGATMAGHTAMAKVGIRSQAAWARQLKMIDEEVQRNLTTKSGPRYARERLWLEDIQKNILGRPMSNADYSGTARFASAVRGYTRSVMLGQLGLTAAFEMKQAIGMMGIRAFMTQLPSFGGFIKALRQGYLPDPGLARDVMVIGGWGNEKAAAYARAREIDEGFAADMLNRVEHGANIASHAVDVLSGNASFTSLSKQISAMMSVQRLHDIATGRKGLGDDVRARLAGQGLDGQMLQDVLDQLKQFSDVQGDRVTHIRHEDWLAHDQEAYEAFQLYMSRQVRDAIQDHDLGETMPFMHSTLGKMFAELKTFFFVAHAKNFLKNLHYADAQMLQTILISMMGEALAYSMQMAINFPHELDKRLDPAVMATAVMGRMANFGFMPMIVDTGAQVLTGQSLLQPGSTSSGSNNRNLFLTPSMMVLQRATQLPGHVIQGALGTSPLTGQEFKNDWSLVPGANTYGLRGLGNWLAEGLPKSEPQPAR